MRNTVHIKHSNSFSNIEQIIIIVNFNVSGTPCRKNTESSISKMLLLHRVRVESSRHLSLYNEYFSFCAQPCYLNFAHIPKLVRYCYQHERSSRAPTIDSINTPLWSSGYRIAGSHSAGPGSVPGKGIPFLDFVSIQKLGTTINYVNI